MSSERRPDQRMKDAQAAKVGVLKGGSIRLSYDMASLAFGVPTDALLEMSERDSLILIQPEKEGVRVSLQPGRKSSVEAYKFVALSYQAMVLGEEYVLRDWQVPRPLRESKVFSQFWENLQQQGSLEGDEDFLQALLYSMWGKLREGIRRDLASRGLDPAGIRNVVGPAGSEP